MSCVQIDVTGHPTRSCFILSKLFNHVIFDFSFRIHSLMSLPYQTSIFLAIPISHQLIKKHFIFKLWPAKMMQKTIVYFSFYFNFFLFFVLPVDFLHVKTLLLPTNYFELVSRSFNVAKSYYYQAAEQIQRCFNKFQETWFVGNGNMHDIITVSCWGSISSLL